MSDRETKSSNTYRRNFNQLPIDRADGLLDPIELDTNPKPIVNGIFDPVDTLFSFASSSTPTEGSTITTVRFTLNFSDPGFPNDGRKIVIETLDHDSTPLVISDVGGTPLARLTSTDISGTGGSFQFTASETNDVLVTQKGLIGATLYIEDSSGRSDQSSINISGPLVWSVFIASHDGSGGSDGAFAPRTEYSSVRDSSYKLAVFYNDGTVDSGTNDPAVRDALTVVSSTSVIYGCSRFSTTIIRVEDEGLTGAFSIPQNTSIERINCSNNQISTLDVSGRSSLTLLRCEYNDISVLDLASLVSLTFVNCSDNNISVLDTEDLALLETCICNDNGITDLNIANKPALSVVNCSSNPITALDTSGSVAIKTLIFNSTNVKLINLSLLTELTSLRCRDCNMNATEVDANLLSADLANVANQDIDIAGNNSPPTVTGLASIASIVARGGSVVTS